ncbi:hypothetical protein CIG75_09980 [Tumebacillus algifaecis]|uniref:PepSY domain-containing protein n=1 Tax=Tumebacillus algifaecis TaxID=1214604 RepID=A0A223D0Z8_9BACL|nr:hypothetical protein [Tumebacillus algifaecis]ASS75282.1 hypothetical protein CIG75_09980 [Tumebacillus algifaecis]
MKKYIWLSIFILTALIGGAVFAVREVTYSQYAGAETSVQTALDTTVLQKVVDVEPYTGGMNGFFISGKDELDRAVYIWTQDGKVVAQAYASQGLTEEKAVAAAEKPVWSAQLVRKELAEQPLKSVVEVIHIAPGPILPKSTTEYRLAPSRFVWELYGKFDNGETGYTYLDFKSGEVLWQIDLPEPK